MVKGSERRTDPPRHLAILGDHFAQIAPEAILVQFLLAGVIPQPAAVGRELVAEQQRSLRLGERMPELELVVDQVDPGPGE